jgi:Flp pilus assembly protein TadD
VERRLWGPARRTWEEILDDRPGDAEAHFSRGLCLAGLGARGEAVEAYRRAVELDGRAVRYRLRLAELLWATEQYHQAINEWRHVVIQAPGNVEARLGLAAAYMHTGARLDAVREYRQVLEIAPDNPVARRALGRG